MLDVCCNAILTQEFFPNFSCSHVMSRSKVLEHWSVVVKQGERDRDSRLSFFRLHLQSVHHSLSLSLFLSLSLSFSLSLCPFSQQQPWNMFSYASESWSSAIPQKHLRVKVPHVIHHLALMKHPFGLWWCLSFSQTNKRYKTPICIWIILHVIGEWSTVDHFSVELPKALIDFGNAASCSAGWSTQQL